MAYHPTAGSALCGHCEIECAGAVVPKIEEGIGCYSLRDRKLDVDGRIPGNRAMHVTQRPALISSRLHDNMWEVKEITGFDVGVDRAFYLTGPVVGAEIISHD